MKIKDIPKEFNIIYLSDRKILIDKNNNKVDITIYGKEKAIKMLYSLKKCKDCLNCENCIGCINCIDCIDCKKCICCIGLKNKKYKFIKIFYK